MPSALAPFEAFLEAVRTATNEDAKRHLFTVLASTGFGDTAFARELALGSEYQVRFRDAGLVRRGAIDSFYGSLVIEFERDLNATGAHALDQLRWYVAGAWTEDGSTRREYLAVATDGLHWQILVPSLIHPSLGVDAENVHLALSETWAPRGDLELDAVGLRDFLNRIVFRSDTLRPSAMNFARDFGLASPAYLAASRELVAKLAELETNETRQLLQSKWSVTLQDAYGSVDTDDELFVKHTYLAVLSRLLVWAALEKRAPSASELSSILNGNYFVGRRISNLVEDDFFRWPDLPSSTDAGHAWTALASHLLAYDLASVSEDVLKPLYEQLVDPRTRHDLGEYYTPDWLAERMTERLLNDWDWSSGVPTVLDPACGSGTFLRAAIDQLRSHSPGVTGEDLLNRLLASIAGIDIHPLAVTIARATYLLAIQDLVLSATELVTLPVFLSNSLDIPELIRTSSLFGDTIELNIEGRAYVVPDSFVHSPSDFDRAIGEVLAVARAYGNPTTELTDAPGSLLARLGSSLDHLDSSHSLTSQLAAMTEQIAQLIRIGRDSNHGYLLRNLYRPSLMRHRFDAIIGNPPWLTIGAISSIRYQEMVVALVHRTGIAPRATGEQSSTEIATLFLALATEFLKESTPTYRARIAFVLPRSVMTASHHRFLREGHYDVPLDINEIWDMAGVTPLFNVPACVLFASYTGVIGGARPRLVKAGEAVSGRLGSTNEADPAEARRRLVSGSCGFELAFLADRSAWRQVEQSRVGDRVAGPTSGSGAYASRFRQGAILYPQTLFVVIPESGPTRSISLTRVTTDPEAARNARVLQKARVDQTVSTSNLYLTAAGDHLLPYSLEPRLWVVVLPTISDPGDLTFGAVDSAALRAAGRLETADWLDWAERRWRRARRRGEESLLFERIDYLSQLSAQKEMRRFIVLYTAAGSRPVAAVVDRDILGLPFVARDRTYWASFDQPAEAHYLAAFLNSEFLAAEIADFMNLGLLGRRDINKRAVDVPWPLFDPSNPRHADLASMSTSLSNEAARLIASCQESTVGRRRRWLRTELASLGLESVEVAVREIAAGV